ncbi:4675_t:CDS:2 [Entrophospora sp. SA101]|nr:4675_t:CDS:2 [Entrophospora sp. SA101]
MKPSWLKKRGNYEMLQRGSTVTYDDQYETYMKNNDGKGWHTRFYKDLSNHSPEEVKGYFKVHHIQVKPFDAG